MAFPSECPNEEMFMWANRMRFRRLNMECTRTKTEASIVITRGKDE